MLTPELKRMYDILVCFLGESKSGLDDSLQLQFSCPRCQDREGMQEKHKYHLEVNIAKGFYNCWKCSSIDDSMHGSVYKLIRNYGTPDLLEAYKEAVREFKESSLYKLNFTNEDFKDDYMDTLDESMSFPDGYTKLRKGKDESTRAFRYLAERGIDWPIIEDYHIGYTTYQKNAKTLSNRIILPSFDAYGNLNYWTGRDFTKNDKRMRYYNPYVERKDIIFNEGKVQWNADITLVEGPFDHIVVPNSIPLLGKGLTEEYKLYQSLYSKANAKINIFLDNDAMDTARQIYRILNRGRLRGNIRLICSHSDGNKLDPSKIFELWGRKGIVSFLNSAIELKEENLILMTC